jgi:carbonic anhydrase
MGFSTEAPSPTQSPVNITTDPHITPSKDFSAVVTAHYRSESINLVNNGENIVGTFTTGHNKVTYQGKDYILKTFHFHTQSEHTFDGHHTAGELHLVHESADGDKLVIGQLLVEEFVSADKHHQNDGHDAQIDSFFDKIIDPNGSPINAQPNPALRITDSINNPTPSISGGTFDPSHMLSGHSDVYEYGGSLTTGELTDATWLVAAQTVVVNATDLQNFRNLQVDFYYPENPDVDAQGYNGRDVQGELVLGTVNSESLFGDRNDVPSDDIIYGRAGNDTLTGGGGNDKIFGETGGDHLSGGLGNDWLIGGVGSDTLTGGGGSDKFVLVPGEGRDTITDFSVGVDKLSLLDRLESFTFEDLSFSGSSITYSNTGEILAILTGVDTTTLTSANFERV